MKTFVWLLLALSTLSLAGVPEAAARPRTPAQQCRLKARQYYAQCIKARYHGEACFKQRGKAYKVCRRLQPTQTPPAPRILPRR